MMAAYAPIETGAKQWAPFLREIADVDAERIAKPAPASGKLQSVVASFH